MPSAPFFVADAGVFGSGPAQADVSALITAAIMAICLAFMDKLLVRSDTDVMRAPAGFEGRRSDEVT